MLYITCQPCSIFIHFKNAYQRSILHQRKPKLMKDAWKVPQFRLLRAEIFHCNVQKPEYFSPVKVAFISINN